MSTLSLPDLSPAEVAFVGQVVSIVTRRGGHIIEVERLRYGGLCVHAAAGTETKWLKFQIDDLSGDGWAASWRGNPITAKDFAWQLCKTLGLYRSSPSFPHNGSVLHEEVSTAPAGQEHARRAGDER